VNESSPAMALVARLSIYFGACVAAVSAVVGAFLVLTLMGLEALPPTSTQPSPRIAAWVERQSIPSPDLPRAHGPAFTDEELKALAARNTSPEPIVRIPIVAMTEDRPAAAASARRPSVRASRRPVQGRPTEVARNPAEDDVSKVSTYQPTARELYAPERNY
jgi:hypothetical protein